MSGQEILQVLWRMKWLVVVIIVVFLGVSAGVTALLPKVYQARATIRVVLPSEQTTDTFAQVQTSQTLARTYAELFKSPNGFRAAVDRGSGDLVLRPALCGARVRLLLLRDGHGGAEG